MIQRGHNDVKLSKEDFDRIVTWLDLNGVYYSTYATAYPNSLTGRCPLDHGMIKRLSELTGVPFTAFRSFNTNRGPQVSFDRPELSSCLARFEDKNDPKYKEALAIIHAGQAMLKKRPRADMEDFKPCETDRRRQRKYVVRRHIERRNREAIRDGRKMYDRTSGNEAGGN